VYIDPFDTATDTLADGRPRCDYRYHATDKYGDVEWARCTQPATTRVRVTAFDDVYEAKVCPRCAGHEVKSAGTMGCPLKFEVLGGLR
jgi:hypothetical protein